MGSITKNVRTHYVHINDGRKFAITEDKFREISKKRAIYAKEKRLSEICFITDPDSTDIVFSGEFRAIVDFTPIKKRDTSIAGWRCGFGTKHSMFEKCDCDSRYGYSWATFRAKALELFGTYEIWVRYVAGKPEEYKHYHPLYSQDLTDAQRNAVISELNRENGL